MLAGAAMYLRTDGQNQKINFVGSITADVAPTRLVRHKCNSANLRISFVRKNDDAKWNGIVIQMSQFVDDVQTMSQARGSTALVIIDSNLSLQSTEVQESQDTSESQPLSVHSAASAIVQHNSNTESAIETYYSNMDRDELLRVALERDKQIDVLKQQLQEVRGTQYNTNKQLVRSQVPHQQLVQQQ